MARRSTHLQPRKEKAMSAPESTEMTAVAETSVNGRKQKVRKVQGYRCFGQKEGQNVASVIKTTATVGRMRKWYEENRELIDSVYPTISFERYTVLDRDMKPVPAS